MFKNSSVKPVSALAAAALLLSIGCASESATPTSLRPSSLRSGLDHPGLTQGEFVAPSATLRCGIKHQGVDFEAHGTALGTYNGIFEASGSWHWSSASGTWRFTEKFDTPASGFRLDVIGT